MKKNLSPLVYVIFMIDFRSSSFVSALGCSDHAPRCSDQPPGGARAAAASWAPRQGNIPTRAHNQHRGYTFLWTQKVSVIVFILIKFK